MPLPKLADEKLIAYAATRFRLLAEPMRLRILLQLEKGECAAGEIARAIGGNQPNVSRHLQALYQGGVITRRRDGNTVFYAIADPAILGICDLMCRTQRHDNSKRR
jgi:DNA-binding transcriptional ArsR family regulator